MYSKDIININEKVNGDLVWDYAKHKEVPLRMPSMKAVVVDINTIDHKFIYGFATIKEWECIEFRTVERNKRTGVIFDNCQIAISEEIFSEGSLLWCPRSGGYVFCETEELKDLVLVINKSYDPINWFPYDLPRVYSSSSLMKKFSIRSIKYKRKFSQVITGLIPYTFGIEYETSKGAIPLHKCFKAGLIPLKDGSISGNEYATIVQDADLGFERILYQTSLLKEFTEFDKECSLHMHLGGFKITPISILILYNLCLRLQSELSDVLPVLSFQSNRYKSSQKNYCKPLPDYFPSFPSLYEWLSGGVKFVGDLTRPHDGDLAQAAKWNVGARYYWVNFVHACFYESPKTIEFRILRPTTNFNKIVNWLYIFSAILMYAEKLALSYEVGSLEMSAHTHRHICRISISDILREVYPSEVANKLIEFESQCAAVSSAQNYLLKDQIGRTTDFEDAVITSCVLS